MEEKSKLDIDQVLEEIKDEDLEIEEIDDSEEEKKEEVVEKKESKEDEVKPSIFKNKKIIFLTIWIILFVVGVYFGFLAYKEKNKIIHVYSIPIKINPEVIYLSKEKKEEVQKEKLYHKYNFNFSFAYEFNGVESKRILSCQITCNLKTKYEINLNQLYIYIQDQIVKEFKNLTKGKFLEEIPNYKKTLLNIIEIKVINSILKVCPDLKKDDIIKTLNIASFRIT